MLTVKKFFLPFLIFIVFIGVARASTLESRVTSYVNNLANSLGDNISSLLKGNDRIKHLDLSIGVKEHLKPIISLMNVNKIKETETGAFFNQNSLNTFFENSINLSTEKSIIFGQANIVANKKIDWLFPGEKLKNINIWLRFFEPNHQAMLVSKNLANEYNFSSSKKIFDITKLFRRRNDKYCFISWSIYWINICCIVPRCFKWISRCARK